MNVMVAGVVGSKMLQWIPGQCIAAMIIDGLDCGARKEPHALPRTHASRFKRNTGPKCVEQETFEGMVVQSAKSIGDIETMMT